MREKRKDFSRRRYEIRRGNEKVFHAEDMMLIEENKKKMTDLLRFGEENEKRDGKRGRKREGLHEEGKGLHKF